MIYEPLSYWKAQGKDYYKNFTYNEQFALQEYKLVELLDTLEFKSVLELGCGFGRITRLISNYYRLDKYTAIDISKDQIKIAKEICSSNIEFICEDIHKFVPKQGYDLIIAVEVLMHIPPANIKNTIDKMVWLCRQHIVSLDYTGDEELHFHNFKHDYDNLYHNRAKRTAINSQSIFHLDKLI